MTHQIELHDSSVEITITIDDGPQAYDQEVVQAFDKALRTWFARVPITSMSFGVTATEGVYDYHFEDNARTWDQVIDFRDNPRDPAMTFSANESWKRSEVKIQEPVLLAVIALRNDINVDSILAERT